MWNVSVYCRLDSRGTTRNHTGQPAPPPLLTSRSYRAALMAAFVSHYESILLSSWSHQWAVSTQTTAALLLSAAVKTSTPTTHAHLHTHTPSLMWMQFRLSACRLPVYHMLWFWSDSGAEFGGGSDRLSAPPPTWPSAAETRHHLDSNSAKEDKIKTASFGHFFFFCLSILPWSSPLPPHDDNCDSWWHTSD